MPYTPPSQQSPASSRNTSPIVSRSSSYSEEVPRSPIASRPQPPRSSHSTSYLHKHRRTPSIPKSDGAPPTPVEAPGTGIQVTDFARSSSVRQSPPPVNGLVIPTGAVISPPDSSENSDGDESSPESRGRVLASNWAQLKEAVRAIDQRREGSPDGVGVQVQTTNSEPVSQTTSPTALSTEARKIAHSRSSTETTISIPRNISFESTTEPSDDSDEDSMHVKPSLVRKKSGELVKPALRPSSRRRYSSMPGTPTYSKSVHFNDNGNQTRHFLQVDKPIAVSAGTSPVETYESETQYPFDESKHQREIRLANFPADTFDRSARPVRVERLFLSGDRQTLIGTVVVQNISFQKLVVARFTLDYWKTTSEVVAEFSHDIRSGLYDGCDRFNFHIKLSDQANIDNKTLFLCVRYNVGGQEHWDNNDNINYQVDFVKAASKPERPSSAGTLGARPLSAIPRSRHTPSRRHESMDDDFASHLDSSSAYHFGNTSSLLDESTGSVKLKPKRGRGTLFSANMEPSPANGLGGRYDFGASLSAALSTAQDKLGRQSGLMHASEKVPSATMGSYFGPVDRKAGPTKTDERPDALTTTRPAMGSDQYKDLVQKFCYFTPGSGKVVGLPPTAADDTTPPPEASTTKTTESEKVASLASSTNSTPSSSLDGSMEQSAHNSYFGRTGRMKTQGYANRASSPMSFGYPYHSNTRDGYLSDSSLTPTAIQG